MQCLTAGASVQSGRRIPGEARKEMITIGFPDKSASVVKIFFLLKDVELLLVVSGVGMLEDIADN